MWKDAPSNPKNAPGGPKPPTGDPVNDSATAAAAPAAAAPAEEGNELPVVTDMDTDTAEPAAADSK